MEFVRSNLRTLLISAACVVALSGCQQEEPKGSVTKVHKPSVEVFIPTLTDHYTAQREYVGFIRAEEQAQLGFELNGKVNKIWVDIGDSVNQGDPLIQLDTRLLVTEENQLKARQAEVKAQLKLIETNLKRQRSLKSKGFSAEAEIDSLTSQKSAYLANLQQLSATLEANTLQQSKSTLRAPFSGTISKRFVSMGDIVTVAMPSLTLLADSAPQAHIGVPAKFAQEIINQGHWQVRVGESMIPAKLIKSGAQISSQSRTIELRFQLPEDTHWVEGQLGYLQHQSVKNQDGFWVPVSSLTDGIRGTWNIFTVDNNDQIRRHHVELIFADNNAAFIWTNIDNNEPVVTAGLHRVVPGQHVAKTLVDNPVRSVLVKSDSKE
ncbi:efflux RND transporter periplasmic adaptor subunit [Vibrio maerlii]|uniref:efflux RND transporter periplasmic adaptor subunit n=1 Tax=Vibrio maerlii TaxID=2231648 RepID=UPI000E3DE81F|nr:efflux RND transporter periplasmic adaptor subunit [Vibrio maerlii]